MILICDSNGSKRSERKPAGTAAMGATGATAHRASLDCEAPKARKVSADQKDHKAMLDYRASKVRKALKAHAARSANKGRLVLKAIKVRLGVRVQTVFVGRKASKANAAHKARRARRAMWGRFRIINGAVRGYVSKSRMASGASTSIFRASAGFTVHRAAAVSDLWGRPDLLEPAAVIHIFRRDGEHE